MDRQLEYDIRKFVFDLNNKEIENELSCNISKLSNLTNYELICYILLSIENGFKESAVANDTKYENGGAKRVTLEWYLKKLLDIELNVDRFKFDKKKYVEFEDEIPKTMILYANYLLNEQFKDMRGINKILIEENDTNEYIFKVPKINDEIDLHDTYYWGKNIDGVQMQNEINIKNQLHEEIFKKYFKVKPSSDDYIKLVEFTRLNKIDSEIFLLCKKNINIDIDKLSSYFISDIFKDKEQLINILGVFMYLSFINIFDDILMDLRGSYLHKIPAIYEKKDLLNIIPKFFEITSDEIVKIIDYLTIKKDLKGGLNEYPLVNIKEWILWIPSSFIMNDFQFSIVNGHYEKKIEIKERDKSVSQSIVDNIVAKCSKYKNIVISTNKDYFDNENKFKGKALNSDIDVGLYDDINNVLLVIECKWKENVCLKGLNYAKICDSVNQIYKNQLDKHKYFLELDEKNLDFIFDNNERVAIRPYFPQVLYIFVDKRIQLHYDNKHALSEFNFQKIINDNSVNGILNLDEVKTYIKTLKTTVVYSEGIKKEPFPIIKYKDKIIKNSVFTFNY